MITIDERKLRKSQKTAATIAIAIMFSLVVYGVLGELFLIDMFSEPVSFYSLLMLLLIVVTAIEIVMIIVLRNFILSGKFKLAGSGGEGAAEKDIGAKEDEFIKRLFISFIVAYALIETIALFGLLLYMTGKDPSVFYGFLGAAFFLMVVQFPKFEDWENRLKDFLSD